MPYDDITAVDVFTAMYEKNNRDVDYYKYVKYWLEAKNVMEVRAVCIDWWNALEDGSIASRYPNPNITEAPKGKVITQARADKFVEEMEKDMLLEKNRFAGLGYTGGPEFTRMTPPQRLAFMQAVWAVMKTDDELHKEAFDLVDNNGPIEESVEQAYKKQKEILERNPVNYNCPY